ncbi:MAG: aldolase/citrate lyase family protein [Chloroflexota bacterium]
MPRVNRAIELLAQDQPIYYHTTQDLTYEGGKAAAATWADFINVDMEHHPYDIAGLSKFMEGLVAGGPTKSGHRTPAVIAVVPVTAKEEYIIRANAWMFTQVLCAGVHGILMTHCNSPAAVRAFVESVRYPFNTLGVGNGLGEGQRGSAGQAHAASIWGLEVPEYLAKADPWPLNPDGELLLGLKIENRHSLQYAEILCQIPGIGFAEWGPGDMGMSLGHPDAHDPPYPADMQAARDKVFAATKAAKIAFLEQVTVENVTQQIDDGVRIGSGRNGQPAAEIGRKYTKRTMPW